MKHVLLSFFLSCSFAFAQNNQTSVSGTITSNDNPVPFATIYVNGGTAGTDADIDGNYSLNVPVGEVTLVVQFQGFRTQKKKRLVL
jgi:outer membrane receptor for ferrienterochelin and colicins